MKKIFQKAVLFASLCACGGEAYSAGLSDAKGFNLFTLGQVDGWELNVYGSLASGGTAYLDKTTVATQLDPRSIEYSVVSAGGVQWCGGYFPAGSLMTRFPLSECFGALSTPIRDSIVSPRQLKEGSVPSIDFTQQASKLIQLHEQLSFLDDTGTLDSHNNQLTFVGNGTDDLQVFSVGFDHFVQDHDIYHLENVGAGTTVVINLVTNGAPTFKNGFFTEAFTRHASHILFNIVAVSQVRFEQVMIPGSILSPKVTLFGVDAVTVDGQVVAGVWRGSANITARQFEGNFSF